jgi:hypothetical protein
MGILPVFCSPRGPVQHVSQLAPAETEPMARQHDVLSWFVIAIYGILLKLLMVAL